MRASNAASASRVESGRAQWLPVAAVLMGTGWGSNQISPLLLVYSRRLGMSTGMLEAMFGVYALGLIPGLLLAGPFSDLRGRRKVVIPAAVLSFVATLALIAGGHSEGLLFLGRFLAGVSSGAVFGAGSAWVRELSRPPYGTSSEHTAARRTAVSMTAGFGLGPLASGLLAQWAPFPTVVPYLPHLILMAGILVAVRTAPETVSSDKRRAFRLDVPGLRNPRFLRSVVPMAPWIFAATSIAFALLPRVVGAESVSGGIAIVASMTTLCLLCGVLIQPLARRIDARQGANATAIVGLVILGAGMLVCAVAAEVGSIWLLIPCAIVLGSAYGMCIVAGLVEVQRLADPEALARLIAVFYALTYSGFAAPYLMALAAHLASYPVILCVTAALALATAVIIREPRGGHKSRVQSA
ncbi:MAG: MFS transporter [Actinomycetota bacterium]|nr:MFS transporter [Actinomycetota bacterium]